MQNEPGQAPARRLAAVCSPTNAHLLHYPALQSPASRLPASRSPSSHPNLNLNASSNANLNQRQSENLPGVGLVGVEQVGGAQGVGAAHMHHPVQLQQQQQPHQVQPLHLLQQQQSLQPVQQPLAGARSNPVHCRHCSLHHPHQHHPLHHLQQHHNHQHASECLHLQPPSQNLVHKQQQHHHHSHHANSAGQIGQRLKQISNYATLAVRQQQQHNGNQLNSYRDTQMQVLESAASPPSQLMCLNSFNNLQVNESPAEEPFARLLQQPPVRPRIGSVSAVVQQSPSSPLAPNGSPLPFIARSTSFSSPRELYISSPSPVHSPSQLQPMLHQPHPPHSYLTSNLSPSDALNLGINLEQYISKRNERERSRVRNVNDAFDNLKSSLPLESDKLAKRMSKVEILRTAISYIRNLEQVLGQKEIGDQCKSSCARDQQSPGQTPEACAQPPARHLSSDSPDSSRSQRRQQRQQQFEQRAMMGKQTDAAYEPHLQSQRPIKSSPTSPSASSVCSSSAASPSSNEGVSFCRHQMGVEQPVSQQQPFSPFGCHENYASLQTDRSHFDPMTQQQQQLQQSAGQFAGFDPHQQVEEQMQQSQSCSASYTSMRNFELN